jgi:hypothetical protein
MRRLKKYEIPMKEFYYMPHTAVHAERERFGRSGNGNGWSHATMTSALASEIKVEMLKRVRNSIYRDADTSLWYIACLRDQGLALEQVKSEQRLVNEMMARDNDSHFDEKEDLMAGLAGVLGCQQPAPDLA